MLGFEEERPWGSFFLQYLWEFCLGMWIAERIFNGKAIDVRQWKWWWIVFPAIIGMVLTGMMVWNGGVLKLYNDIPSLIGYLSMLLLIYRIGAGFINKFFVWASSFGYELYLVHSLVFSIFRFWLKSYIPIYVLIVVCLVAAYMVGYGYNVLLKKIGLK